MSIVEKSQCLDGHSVPGQIHFGRVSCQVGARVSMPWRSCACQVSTVETRVDESQCLDGHSVPGQFTEDTPSWAIEKSLNALTVIRSRDFYFCWHPPWMHRKSQCPDGHSVPGPPAPERRLREACQGHGESQCLDGHSVPGLHQAGSLDALMPWLTRLNALTVIRSRDPGGGTKTIAWERSLNALTVIRSRDFKKAYERSAAFKR